METMQRAVQAFMAADEVASKSVSTRKRHAVVLRYLVAEVGATTPISRLTRTDVDLTLAKCRIRVVESTLNAYRISLRAFGRFILDMGWVKRDPAAHLKTTKTSTDPAKRKGITAEQARNLIEVATARHPRDGSMVATMLLGGLRESEVRGLTWSGVKFQENLLEFYRPKQRSWHRVPMALSLSVRLHVWAEVYQSLHGPLRGDWYVFPALSHRSEKPGFFRMHPDWPMVATRMQTDIGQRIKMFLREVGETDLRGRASHVTRRTSARLLLASGADVRDVQVLLGHASLDVTERYLSQDAAREKLAGRMEHFEI